MRKKMLGTTKLMVVDDLSPEDVAMLQALYSRSAESAEVHLEKVRAAGSGKFMSQFYVNYGHKSIADCGSTTMFIENVSLLAAKAIQDWPLYSGQETSTRFIDMSKQTIVDPVKSELSGRVLQRWMDFYTSHQSQVSDMIRAKYSQKPGEKDEDYAKAVTARTFDTLRGFLPAGITTQLAWHSNIRQAGDHLIGLTKHPAEEIRTVSKALQKLLGEQYPSSGAGLNLATVSGVDNKDVAAVATRDAWERQVAAEVTYFTSSRDETLMRLKPDALTVVDAAILNLLKTRPRGCVLPHALSALGYLHFAFGLDFGSFRDLQRHRNGVCLMPLLTMDHGFEDWYLKELGPLEADARALIDVQKRDIEALTDNPVERQYYIALGFRVPCRVSYGLPATVYIMELRSGKTIHPTLRSRVHQMIHKFQEAYPEVPIHVDMDADDWSVRRGQQTIQAR